MKFGMVSNSEVWPLLSLSSFYICFELVATGESFICCDLVVQSSGYCAYGRDYYLLLFFSIILVQLYE